MYGLVLYHTSKDSDTIGKAALNSICGYRRRNIFFIPELHWKISFYLLFFKIWLNLIWLHLPILITARLNFSFASHSGFPSFWGIWIWWRKFSERLWRHFRDWSTVPRKADRKSWDFSVGRRVGSGGILSGSINTWKGGAERMGPDLFSGAQWQNKRQRPQTEAQEVPFGHQVKLIYCMDAKALAQVSQRSCRVSFIGDRQKLDTDYPGPYDLGWQLDQMTAQGLFQPQLFCDSIIELYLHSKM